MFKVRRLYSPATRVPQRGVAGVADQLCLSASDASALRKLRVLTLAPSRSDSSPPVGLDRNDLCSRCETLCVFDQLEISSGSYSVSMLAKHAASCTISPSYARCQNGRAHPRGLAQAPFMCLVSYAGFYDSHYPPLSPHQRQRARRYASPKGRWPVARSRVPSSL